jgi:hypothetical protein
MPPCSALLYSLQLVVIVVQHLLQGTHLAHCCAPVVVFCCHCSALSRSQTLNQAGISSSAILTTASFVTQFNLLAQRTAKNSWRNNLIFKGKLAQTVFLALVVGLIFLRVKVLRGSKHVICHKLFWYSVHVSNRQHWLGTEDRLFRPW